MGDDERRCVPPPCPEVEEIAIGSFAYGGGVLLVGEDDEHAKLLDADTADKGLLIEHLLHDHDAPRRRADVGMSIRSLVIAHLARHPKTECPVDIIGPIPEGGIVVIRGGEQFPAEVVERLLEDLLRISQHDRFTLMLLNTATPGAVAVIDARMDIDQVKEKLGVS